MADGLTAKTTFDRPEAIRGWCVRLPQGAPVVGVEAFADRLLVCPDVVALGAPAPRVSSGVRGGAARNARRYTTGEMIATEVAVLTAATAACGAGVVLAGYLTGGGLDHGYALTVHQSQGMTCE